MYEAVNYDDERISIKHFIHDMNTFSAVNKIWCDVTWRDGENINVDKK